MDSAEGGRVQSRRLLQANICIVSPGEAGDGQIDHVDEEVGDALTFPTSGPHGYRSAGTGVVRVLWVNSPAPFWSPAHR